MHRKVFRGRYHYLPVAFYRLKIGPLLAEIWPETSRNPVGLGPKGGGGASIGGGAFIGEFTVFLLCNLSFRNDGFFFTW